MRGSRRSLAACARGVSGDPGSRRQLCPTPRGTGGFGGYRLDHFPFHFCFVCFFLCRVLVTLVGGWASMCKGNTRWNWLGWLKKGFTLKGQRISLRAVYYGGFPHYLWFVCYIGSSPGNPWWELARLGLHRNPYEKLHKTNFTLQLVYNISKEDIIQ